MTEPDKTERDVEKELDEYDKKVDGKLHEGLPVHGYKQQSGANVGIVNFHKEWEERVLRHFDWLNTHDGLDKRWLSIAKTHIEQGFMAVNRAVFQPGRIDLAEDEHPDKLPANQRKRW